MKVDINAKNIHGNTPLHIAVLHNSIESILLLIKNGCKINRQNNVGNTPLHLAAFEDKVQKNVMYTFLIQKRAQSHVKNNNGKTPEDIQSDFADIYQCEHTPLYTHEEFRVRGWLTHPNRMTEQKGYKSQTRARKNKQITCHTFPYIIDTYIAPHRLKINNIGKVASYIVPGEITYANGTIELGTFSWGTYTHEKKTICNHRHFSTNPPSTPEDIRSEINKRYNHVARCREKNHRNCEKYIEQYMQDTYEIEIDEATIRLHDTKQNISITLYKAIDNSAPDFHKAVMHTDNEPKDGMSKTLSKNNISLHTTLAQQKSRSSSTHDKIQNVTQKPQQIAQNIQHENTIHQAVQEGNFEKVNELICNDKSLVNSTSKNGNTPLHIAALKGNTDTIQLLCQHKANTNAINKKGDSPLHMAIQNSKTDAITMLVHSCGADINQIDADGQTPIHTLITQEKLDCNLARPWSFFRYTRRCR
jgi:ankyrin repeat protein